jgi:TPR repeat protein
LTPEERANAEKFVARGERDLEQGNIAQARQFFQRAAQIGLARGALMLAATYDPRELSRMRAVGVQPNVAEARKWYMRAVELGAPEAAQKLATLGGN